MNSHNTINVIVRSMSCKQITLNIEMSLLNLTSSRMVNDVENYLNFLPFTKQQTKCFHTAVRKYDLKYSRAIE